MSGVKVNINEDFIKVISSFSGMVEKKHIVSLNNDIIYSKGFGGAMSGSFKPKSNLTDEEFAVYDFTEFLAINSFMDEDKKTLVLDGDVLTFKDDRKEIKYLTCPLEYAPTVSETTIESFDESEELLAKMVITEEDLELCQEASSLISMDKLLFKVVDEAVELEFASSITENSIAIPIVKGKALCDNGIYAFPDIKVFNVFYPGIYQVEVKAVEIADNDFIIMRCRNISLKGNENITDLEYLIILDDEV